jgi:hypothetical protein
MNTIYYQIDLDEIDIADLIDYIEGNDYSVFPKDSENTPRGSEAQNLFEELCAQFDLPRAATTKQQLISHINSLL